MSSGNGQACRLSLTYSIVLDGHTIAVDHDVHHPRDSTMRKQLLRLAILFPLLAISGQTPHAAASKAKPPFYADKANLMVYRDDAGKTAAVKTLADWQKRRDHILANMQLVMGPLPPDLR